MTVVGKQRVANRGRVLLAIISLFVIMLLAGAVGMALVAFSAFFLIGGTDLVVHAWQHSVPQYQWVLVYLGGLGLIGGMSLGIWLWWYLVFKTHFLSEEEKEQLSKYFDRR